MMFENAVENVIQFNDGKKTKSVEVFGSSLICLLTKKSRHLEQKRQEMGLLVGGSEQ